MSRYTIFLKDGDVVPVESNRIVESCEMLTFKQVRLGFPFVKTVAAVRLGELRYYIETGESKTKQGVLPDGVTAVGLNW